MSLRRWNNGEKSEIVQAIIEYNTRLLGKHLSQNMLCLTSTERKNLGSDYLSEGLRVFDITEETWYKYNNNTWVECATIYNKTFSKTDWTDNEISIGFSTHFIAHPLVQLFIKNGGVYTPVLGGVEVDAGSNVRLLTDLPFDGKVVIK